MIRTDNTEEPAVFAPDFFAAPTPAQDIAALLEELFALGDAKQAAADAFVEFHTTALYDLQMADFEAEQEEAAAFAAA